MAREFLAVFKSTGAEKLQGDFKKIGASTGALDTGLAKVNDTSVRTQRRMSELGVSLGDLVRVGAGLAIGKWLGDAAMGASNMETSFRGVSAVLGETVANDIAAWAKETGDALNLSQQDALVAARSFATYAGAVDAAGGDSVKFTQDMITLSQEIASFAGADPAAVVQALTGALRGEFDTLQTFGINLNAATVEAEALKLGLADTASELTEQDKMWAAYNAIMEQSGFAMGSTARNSDTLSGSMADLKQKTEDLQTEVGQELAPALTGLADAASLVLDAFSKLPGVLKTAILTFGGLVAVQKTLGPAFSGVSLSLKNLRADMAATSGAVGKFKVGMSGIASAFNPWTLAITAGVTALGYWMQSQEKAKGHVDELVATLDSETQAFTENTRAAIANALEKDGLLEVAERLGVDLPTLTDAILGEKDARHELAVAYVDNFNAATNGLNLSKEEQQAAQDKTKDWEKLNTAINDETSSANKAVAEGKRLKEATQESGDAAGDAADNTDRLKDGIKKLNEETRDLNKELETLLDNYSSLRGDALSIEEATVKISDGMIDLAKSVQENGTSLDEFTAKGAANRLVLGEIIEGTDELVAAMIREGRSTAEVNAARRQGNEQLRKTMLQAGFTKEQIDEFIKSVKKTPKQQEMSLAVVIKQEKLIAFNQKLKRLKAKKLELEVSKPTFPPGTPGPLRDIIEAQHAGFVEAGIAKIDAQIGLTKEEKRKLKGLEGEALINMAFGKGEKKRTKDELDDVANPDGKPRKAKFRAFIDPTSYAREKARLDALAKDETKTITVETRNAGGGGGGGSEPEGRVAGRMALTPTPSPLSTLKAVSATLLAATPTVAGVQPYVTSQGRVAAVPAGAAPERIHLAPKSTPVAVYLDGVEIADHLELRAKNLAAVGSVRNRSA